MLRLLTLRCSSTLIYRTTHSLTTHHIHHPVALQVFNQRGIKTYISDVIDSVLSLRKMDNRMYKDWPDEKSSEEQYPITLYTIV